MLGCNPQLPIITEKVNKSKNKTVLLVRIILNKRKISDKLRVVFFLYKARFDDSFTYRKKRPKVINTRIFIVIEHVTS